MVNLTSFVIQMWEERYESLRGDSVEDFNNWFNEFFDENHSYILSDYLCSWVEEELDTCITAPDNIKFAIYNSIDYDEVIKQIMEFIEEEKEEKEVYMDSTDDKCPDYECPICYIKYGEQEDGSFICQDGIYNSDMGKESLCDHSVCERCAQTLYNNLRKKEDEDASECCPLCRCDWTLWLLSHYNDEDSDDDDSDEEEEQIIIREEITVYDDTIITGLMCKRCNNEVPPHTVAEHLHPEAPSHPIFICPHTR